MEDIIDFDPGEVRYFGLGDLLGFTWEEKKREESATIKLLSDILNLSKCYWITTTDTADDMGFVIPDIDTISGFLMDPTENHFQPIKTSHYCFSVNVPAPPPPPKKKKKKKKKNPVHFHMCILQTWHYTV